MAGVDQTGAPSIYFLDPNVGPCRYGSGGLEWCGSDIRDTWIRVNKDATKVVCSGIYDPVSRQVQWSVAVDGSNTPNIGLTLQTDYVKSDSGWNKEWLGHMGRASDEWFDTMPILRQYPEWGSAVS